MKIKQGMGIDKGIPGIPERGCVYQSGLGLCKGYIYPPPWTWDLGYP